MDAELYITEKTHSELAMAYFDYRKQGQFDWTTPAILFACLTFSLIAPNYIWKVL